MRIIEYGNKVRITGTTGANDDSSRSHAILQIKLLNSNKLKKQETGMMSFID